MKLNFTFYAITAFCLLNTQVLHSQSLTQIYDLAKTNDLQYQANIAQFNANKEIVAISRGSLLPQISGNMSYGTAETDTTTTSTLNFAPSVDSNGNSTTDTLSYSLSLEQALINFSALNTYRSGKIQAAAAEVQLAADKQSLIIRSAQAYFDVLSATDQLKTSQSEEKALETQLEQTRQRYEVGLISINDVHEAQAAFDSAFANRLSTETNVGIQLEALTILTGRSHNRLATLKDNFTAIAPTPNDKQVWIDAARKNNLLLQVSKLNADAAVFDANTAKANRFPELTGSLNYNFNDSDQSSGANTRQSESDQISASLNLRIPIYNGGSLTASQRQAAQSQLLAREQFLLTQRNTIQTTRSVFLQVNNDIAQINARKQAIISNQSALQATQAGYDAGTRDIVDVVNAQRNLFQAQRDYFTTVYNYIINTLELKQAAGMLSEIHLQELDNWLEEKTN
jgi:outer membrane protein